MLQLHLSDLLFHCLLRCDLYQRFDSILFLTENSEFLMLIVPQSLSSFSFLHGLCPDLVKGIHAQTSDNIVDLDVLSEKVMYLIIIWLGLLCSAYQCLFKENLYMTNLYLLLFWLSDTTLKGPQRGILQWPFLSTWINFDPSMDR